METTMSLLLASSIGCLANDLRPAMLLEVHNTCGRLEALLGGVPCLIQGLGIITMVLKDQTASLALEHVITLDVKMDQAAGPPAP
jgi:hypothetical protein